MLCDGVIRRPVEACIPSVFTDLDAEDLVFFDSSHRSFQGSDVTVVFTEIIPSLAPGCLYIHDIFLPNDYPTEWQLRYDNEQYLLMAYLLGGAAGDQIVLPIHDVEISPDLVGVLDPIIRHPHLRDAGLGGGSFWMRRAAKPT